MNTPKLVVLVRHAESLANKAKMGDVYVPECQVELIRGISDHDIPLTDIGHWQATMTGPALRDKYGVFDAVYDSGYVRTVQTRLAAMKAYTTDELLQMEMLQSYLIRERERGYTFDMTPEEAIRHFPWLQRYYEVNGHFYSCPPGGQSHAHFCPQVDWFMAKEFPQWAGKKVLIFTHGHTIRAFRFLLEGWTPEYYHDLMSRGGCVTDNCGVTEYRHNEATGKLELQSFNKVYYPVTQLVSA